MLQKQRFQGRLRWTAAGVLLLVAALTFYYYYTNYHSDSSSSPSSRRTASSIKEKPAKDKSTTAKDKSTTAKAKRSTSKGKKASQSTSKKKAGKKKTPAMEDFEKLQNRLLRQPIPASDVDRPHVLDIITADNLIVAKKYEEALERFNAILKQFPQSPRAQFGKGITLSYLAEVKQSNKLMDSAINFFKMAGESIVASDLIKVPSLAAMADKAQSRGNYQLATEGMEKLVALKPDSAVYANQLGVLYLTIGKTKKAKNYFKKCIKKSEDNHFASAQLGAILLEERQYEKSLPLLMDGIRKDPDIKTNARFYNYAGEALTKLNRSHEVSGPADDVMTWQCRQVDTFLYKLTVECVCMCTCIGTGNIWGGSECGRVSICVAAPHSDRARTYCIAMVVSRQDWIHHRSHQNREEDGCHHQVRMSSSGD